MSIESRRKFRVGRRIAVVAAAGLVFATMSPASAAGAGVTTSGETNVNVSGQLPAAPLCLKATATTITLHNTGTFTAGIETFVGDTTGFFSTSTDYWFGPEGIFGDELCTTPTTVPGTLSVTKVSGTGTVSCSGGASYSRVNTNAEITTAGNLGYSCTVGATTATPSVLTFAGSQQPCLADFPVPDPCTVATEWVGTYTQAGA
jgi:hypothetical protein